MLLSLAKHLCLGHDSLIQLLSNVYIGVYAGLVTIAVLQYTLLHTRIHKAPLVTTSTANCNRACTPINILNRYVGLEANCISSVQNM